VRQLLESNENVTALARNALNIRQLQELQRAYPARLQVLEADVTKELDLDRAAKLMENTTVDVLINNAGVFKNGEGAFKNLNLQMVENEIAVNALGPMRVTLAFFKLLDKAAHPVVVNITSQMGSIADNNSGGFYGYRMSKAALNMFTKSLSIDLPKATVLSLHPGWVKTDMGGNGAQLETKDSVTGLLKVIRECTSRDSGNFLNFRGDQLAW
jgi:NAD(P)-dependent dehydrogenase (short-subunit alcohol dehydrogenase family)